MAPETKTDYDKRARKAVVDALRPLLEAEGYVVTVEADDVLGRRFLRATREETLRYADKPKRRGQVTVEFQTQRGRTYRRHYNSADIHAATGKITAAVHIGDSRFNGAIRRKWKKGELAEEFAARLLEPCKSQSEEDAHVEYLAEDTRRCKAANEKAVDAHGDDLKVALVALGCKEFIGVDTYGGDVRVELHLSAVEFEAFVAKLRKAVRK